MKLQVQYMAQIKQAVGFGGEEFDADPGCSAGSLVREVAQRHGEAVRRVLLDEEGQPRPSVLLFVAGQQVEPDRALREGDDIVLLAPMAGG